MNSDKMTLDDGRLKAYTCRSERSQSQSRTQPFPPSPAGYGETFETKLFADLRASIRGFGIGSKIPLAILFIILSACAPENSSVRQWHTLTLSFEGPQTSETSEYNPFTNYRLLVKFTHRESDYWIRGFYAADGNAAETSADAGNIW
ncbi:MAG: DUF5060 domain-containing protein, partial [Verrucomicrobiota bacterium]